MESYNIDVASYTHMCVGLWTPSLFVRDYGRGLATRRGRESHPPLQTANLDEKRAMLEALKDNITAMEEKLKHQKTSAPVNNISTPPSFDSLVEHVNDLALDDTLCTNILAELQTLNLMRPGRGVKTQWLSPTDESYNYGKVLNSPMPIKDYPNICKLTQIVNSHPSTTGDMDCCLVTRYPSSKSTLSLHSDNEKLISQTSSICSVSFGAPRELQIVLNGKMLKNGEPDLSPDLVLPATDKTMNVMKPGAQSKMLHAVGKARGVSSKSQSEVRYSLSFRKINSAIKDDKAGTVEEDHPNTKADDKTQPKKKNVILVAGDSFAARLKADLLGKGKQDVRNIAKGGRKLEEVQKDIEDFVKKNPDVEVIKLFVSVGANDIRYCQNGIKHLKNAVCDLMRSIKTMLPGVKAWFQSIPPIHPNGSRFTARNVIQMNILIYDMCSRFRLFYLNAFHAFFNQQGCVNT
ncbi:MAG: hypothetical protein GY820_15730, partial [Gammaproteobacteria bacterium]|nr:hypothetical protein [Gammaproteobacteria bacterium]